MTHKIKDMARRCMVLATDLDGTFLGGSDAERDRLYQWVHAQRDSIGLVFVTGRDPEFIIELCSDGRVPWPDFVVGDVGTTIATTGEDRSINPIEQLEEEIARTWSDLGQRVREKLEGHPGLRVQDTPFRYRVSYHMDPASFDDSAVEIVKKLGGDALVSDNRYFDVLPRGVSKGPSLLRLVDHIGVSRDQVLAAGDTMNDFSMLVAGTPAVAVGGSERPLLDALPKAPNILRAQAVGAAGILEAIDHFSLHPAMAGV